MHNSPDDTDMEFRTVVIPMELISESGDHIVGRSFFVHLSRLKANMSLQEIFIYYNPHAFKMCVCVRLSQHITYDKHKHVPEV